MARGRAARFTVGAGLSALLGAAAAGAVGAGGAGCGSDGSARGGDGGSDGAAPIVEPIVELVGELHLHQFPLGGHAWAAFVATPIPVSAVTTDTLVEYQPPPARTVGPCALYVPPRCTPACTGGALCLAPDACGTLPHVEYVDAGPIDVTGSQLHADIHLGFVSPDSPYASDPPPGKEQLFAGGERLAFHGALGDRAFSGSVHAPLAVAVTAPDLSQPLRFPTNGPLAVRWVAEGADQLVVFVNVSQPSGDSAWIRCVTADVGALDVPAELMAALPSPPRAIRLEVERDEERVVEAARPGDGVLVHAAQSTWKNDME